MPTSRRGKAMTVYLAESELDAAKAAATDEGVSLNEHVRRALRRYHDGQASRPSTRRGAEAAREGAKPARSR